MADQPFDEQYPETAKLLEGYVPWKCACGKTAEAKANTPIRCTCGRVTWSAAS